MADDPLKIWETLFQRALYLLDAVEASGNHIPRWSFGGGTVLMLKHRHRFSKDIDIFVPDPQVLGHLTPRLNPVAESLTSHYDEHGDSIKLWFPEGEINFVASAPLTAHPCVVEVLCGREVMVETSTEIVAKKVWHRGAQFTARDIFDLAMVAEKEPASLREIKPILRDRRVAMLERITKNEASLRETFEALDVLDYRRSYDECVELVKQTLG